MFRTLVSGERVPQRLLQFQDGERRMTNLWHLAERLQAAAERECTGMEGLTAWLAERRRSEASADEEEQLRLESDEHLVKIVTIHKSKGLEYPVVFCPFLWSGGLWADRAKTVLCHDPKDDGQAVMDLGSEELEVWRPQACREEMAENLRLLYVALTRAKSRCYLIWGKINELGTSPLAWLLHQPQTVDTPLTLDTVKTYVEERSAAELRADLDAWAAQAPGAIDITPRPTLTGRRYAPTAHDEPPLAARRFPWQLRQRWRLSSFSALASGESTELPDHDAVTRPVTDASPSEHGPSIATFPRGVRAGSCLHAMLQHLDFTQADDRTLTTLVSSDLQAYGFEASWTPIMADLLARVVATPLDASGTLRLRDIPADRRLNELEFSYPLHGLTPDGLQRLLGAHGFGIGSIREEIGRLTFAPAQGYMRRFIELVCEANGRFYLMDYKSHWLGDTLEDYRQEALAAVMARDMYYLQYLIYSVAVHHYLTLRLRHYDYETQFGGVFYLFVRGMHPDPGPTYGVFQDRPGRDLIEALDRYLASGSLPR
jgi:exodeoxyribonuclease V beta subunit